MAKKNNWIYYKSGNEVDTNDEAFMKFMVRLKGGRELVACFSMICFIDLESGVDIDEEVVAYRELEDDELD